MHGGKDCDGDARNIKLILKGIKNVLKYGKNPNSMVNCITYTAPLAEGDAKGVISYFLILFITIMFQFIYVNTNLSFLL